MRNLRPCPQVRGVGSDLVLSLLDPQRVDDAREAPAQLDRSGQLTALLEGGRIAAASASDTENMPGASDSWPGLSKLLQCQAAGILQSHRTLGTARQVTTSTPGNRSCEGITTPVPWQSGRQSVLFPPACADPYPGYSSGASAGRGSRWSYVVQFEAGNSMMPVSAW